MTTTAPINTDVAGKPLTEAEDAIAAVYVAFESFNNAKYETSRAQAIVDLSNAVSDLISWHSMYDFERGQIVFPDED